MGRRGATVRRGVWGRFRGLGLLAVVALAVGVGVVSAPVAVAASNQLLSGAGMVRAGHVWLSASSPDQVTVGWKPVWAADANAEQLYLVDSAGALSAQVDIAAGTASGSKDLAVPRTSGDWELAVPGYSFRGYTVRAASGTSMQLEPTKLHVTAQVDAGTELYFRVAAGQQATLCGKYYGGVSSLRAVRTSDGTTVNLALPSHAAYADYDKAALPASTGDQVWKLSLGGSGKAAFWLDGTDNLFAPTADQLHPLVLPTGTDTVTLGTEQVGLSPKVGVAMPYYAPPAPARAAVASLGAKAGSYYTFYDAGAANEASFRAYYAQQGLTTDVTLLAGTGRQEVPTTAQAASGLDKFQTMVAGLGGGTHYVSFADEPNLNFASYDAYAAYFGALIGKVTPAARAAGVRVAVPASSRFTGGPFRTDGAYAANRGYVWAQRLLASYGSQIDAVAWHEWDVRDLLATRQYRTSIQAAADLVGRGPDGRPAKDLVIDQTNISSGTDLSPYDQETQYAALWWTSVVVNSSADGLLDVVDWFKVADEGGYPKGMLDASGTTVKPVGVAQQFIAGHWGDQVYRSTSSSFEVDAVQLGSGTDRVLLGVNKTARAQDVTVPSAGALCSGTVDLLGPDGTRRSSAVSCTGGVAHVAVPAQTIFAVTWSSTAAAPDPGPQPTPNPEPTPSVTPGPAPTGSPTATPTATPSPQPSTTATPTSTPSPQPTTTSPTPTPSPTVSPTPAPSPQPTPAPGNKGVGLQVTASRSGYYSVSYTHVGCAAGAAPVQADSGRAAFAGRTAQGVVGKYADGCYRVTVSDMFGRAQQMTWDGYTSISQVVPAGLRNVALTLR